MSIYAQQQDVENYIEGWTTADAVALNRLIVRAEQDLEPLLFPLRHAAAPTQVISSSGASGGTFILDWVGTNPASTPAESFNVPAAQLQTDLQALADIGSGNVTVIGRYPVWTVVWSDTWIQSKHSSLAVPLLQADVSSITPFGASMAVTLVRGRRLNPLTDLNANQAIALANAVCAQVEYRIRMGPAFFVRPQYKNVKGPDFATSGKLPRIAPKARQELSGTGLILTGGRAVTSYGRRGVGKGWANF